MPFRYQNYCHNEVVGKDVSKAEFLKQIAKVAVSHRGNRCDKCGRRLKIEPGGLLSVTIQRYGTCRSCGYENPTFSAKIAESLEDAGYNIPGMKSTADLPECFGCAVELQVSKDFTKVFCRSCGREWAREGFDDMMGGTLSPDLAGVIPVKPDKSKIAMKLEQILNDKNIDFSSPYLVIEAHDRDAPVLPFFKSIKQGWNEARSENMQDSKIPAKPERYVAIFEDYCALYILKQQELTVEEHLFEDLFEEDKEGLTFPFSSILLTAKDHARFSEIYGMMFNIFQANSKPYSDGPQGEAAQQQQTSTGPKTDDLATQLEKLASLRSQGMLDEEEFARAKQKLLDS